MLQCLRRHLGTGVPCTLPDPAASRRGWQDPPPAAPAARGGEMLSDKQTISCSFWLPIKSGSGMGFFFFLMLLMVKRKNNQKKITQKPQNKTTTQPSRSCKHEFLPLLGLCSGVSLGPRGAGRAGLQERPGAGACPEPLRRDGPRYHRLLRGCGRRRPLHGWRWGRSSPPSSSSPSPPRDAGARARTGFQTTAEEEEEEGEEEEAVAADDEGEEEGEEEAFQKSHRFLGCRLRWR